MPDADGKLGHVIGGLGNGDNPLAVAAISAKLKAGTYRIEHQPETWPVAWIAAGWADGAYRFDRYLSEAAEPPSACDL